MKLRLRKQNSCPRTLILLFITAFPSAGLGAEPTYWTNIRPILRKHCTACHNARKAKQTESSGGLALDTFESLTRTGKKALFTPGRSKESKLLARLTTANEEERMPLNSPPLPPASIELIRRWIDAGAPAGVPEKTTADVRPISRPVIQARRTIRLQTGTMLPRSMGEEGKPGRLEMVLKTDILAPVTAVAFSPDERFLAIATYENVVVWEMAKAQPRAVLTGEFGAVHDVRFSPDGLRLCVAGGQPSEKGETRLFRTSDWKLDFVLLGHGDTVFSVAFHPKEPRLASASFDKRVGIWNLQSRKLERMLTNHSDAVYSVAYQPGGKWLASASRDRSIKIFETSSYRCTASLGGMTQDVTSLAAHPDGRRLVSATKETPILWWDVTTSRRVRQQGGHDAGVHEVCFSSDGRWLASASADKTVRIWNGAGGQPVRSLTVGSMVYSTSLSSSGRWLAAGSTDGLVRLWEPSSGRQLATLLALNSNAGAGGWLAVTPEGFASGTDGVRSAAQWLAAGKPADQRVVARALWNPEAVAGVIQGKRVSPPRFER